MVPHRIAILLLAALLIPTIVCAADFTGGVVGVFDCDTIDALNDHHVERIRLNGIDCPEKSQVYKERTVPGTVSCYAPSRYPASGHVGCSSSPCRANRERLNPKDRH
jgi:hypothetical protein